MSLGPARDTGLVLVVWIGVVGWGVEEDSMEAWGAWMNDQGASEQLEEKQRAARVGTTR